FLERVVAVELGAAPPLLTPRTTPGRAFRGDHAPAENAPGQRPSLPEVGQPVADGFDVLAGATLRADGLVHRLSGPALGAGPRDSEPLVTDVGEQRDNDDEDPDPSLRG